MRFNAFLVLNYASFAVKHALLCCGLISLSEKERRNGKTPTSVNRNNEEIVKQSLELAEICVSHQNEPKLYKYLCRKRIMNRKNRRNELFYLQMSNSKLLFKREREKKLNKNTQWHTFKRDHNYMIV